MEYLDNLDQRSYWNQYDDIRFVKKQGISQFQTQAQLLKRNKGMGFIWIKLYNLLRRATAFVRHLKEAGAEADVQEETE